MLYVFRVDIGETYRFETDLAFKDIKTLKLAIEQEHGISPSKQILIISGGELLDDDAVQVCMKTRDTGAGTEENPIYLLDKAHLERPRPVQLPLATNSIPMLDDATMEQWLAMPSTYETIVQRADTAQNFNGYAQKLVQSCDRLVREQQAQYQGWMAVIANIEDTLSSFLLNRSSFDRSYQSYLADRSSYLELFQSLPRAIEVLHQLKLPTKLVSLIDPSNGIYQRSTVSSSTSSSSISLTAATTSSTHPNVSLQNESDTQPSAEISLFDWITAQLANVKVDDIINGCTHVIDECNEELLSSMNKEIDDLSKKISNHELKHMVGIEERFALLQNELSNAQQLQHEQKDCAACLVSQRQTFSSNVGNQRDTALIQDISRIHSLNLAEVAKRHRKLVEIEKKIRKSKQDIIDQLHRRFKSLMLLQRHLVDCDAKQSLYIHKLNRTKKTMTFLRQLNQSPHLYRSFLFECFRRKQYSNVFNEFSETIHRKTKSLHQEEISSREQFIKQYEPHFLFNLLPALKVLPTFFLKEPLPVLDANLPDLSLTEIEQLFTQLPEVQPENNSMSLADPPSHLDSLIRCTRALIDEEPQLRSITPLTVFIPPTTTTMMINAEATKQLPSPTNSSTRSTVVRSQSSSDVDSPNEAPIPPVTSEESAEKTDGAGEVLSTSQEPSPADRGNSANDKEVSPKEEEVSVTHSPASQLDGESSSSAVAKASPSAATPTSTNEEEDDYIKCSLETVYTSTEMAVSPPYHRCSASQQTDDENSRAIAIEFVALRNQCEETTKVQHELIVDYHQTIVKVITSLEQSNKAHQEQIEQLRSDIQNHLQDNETLKIQYDISEQLKQELAVKCTSVEHDLNEFRRTSDIQTSQIVKALQSDFEFEFEKMRCEHQEVLQELAKEQDNKLQNKITVDVQTDGEQMLHKQTSDTGHHEHRSAQTDQMSFVDQTSQTTVDDTDETMRRSITKDQQLQFNLAIQRAVQNATGGQKKQITQLEEQLADKRLKIIKLKECVKKLQNFYTLSSTPPPITSSVNSSLITSSTDDEQATKEDEMSQQLPDEILHRTAFLKRSEPISMPSTFIVQSMLAAGNAASSPKTERPTSTTVAHLLIDTCSKSSPSESGAAVELYTPFAASPPNPSSGPASPQTPVPMPTILSSPPSASAASTVSAPPNNSTPQALPIAFFTVNRSDRVIIYFDSAYQHYMIYTCLPTLHFIHSDCYELFHIQQKSNLSQQQNESRGNNVASVIGSLSGENISGSFSTTASTLINTSMMNSTLMGTNGLNPSSTPLLGQVTDKEYCQAKKPNNRFNVPLGTKFYRVRVKPWKPTLSPAQN